MTRAWSPRLALLAAVVGLSHGRLAADGADKVADAVAAAADRIAQAVRAGDAAGVKALASKDSPDPWLVADHLVGKGENKAAAEFAKAPPRKDVEALPDYVRAAAGRPAEDDARATYAAARGLLASDNEGALRLLGPPVKGPDTVTRLRLAFARANALLNLRRFAEAADVWDDVGAAALRLGWLRHAADALREGGRVCWRVPDLRRALSFAERLLAVEERREKKDSIASAWITVGAAHDALGDSGRALGFMERALRHFETTDDKREVVLILGNLGVIRRNLGDLDEAVRLDEQALALAEAIGSRDHVARTRHRLAAFYLARGDLSRALELDLQAAREFEALGQGGPSAAALVSAAHIQRLMGDEPRAFFSLDRALVLARRAGDAFSEAAALANLGALRIRYGEVERGIELSEQANAIWERGGDRRGLANGLIALAASHVGQRKAERALPLLDRAQTLAEELGSAPLLQRAGMVRANALNSLGQLDEALRTAEVALRKAEEQGDLDVIGHAWLTLGDVHHMRHEFAEALVAVRRAEDAARRTRATTRVVVALAAQARALSALKDPAGTMTVARAVAVELETLTRGHDEESAGSARERGVGALEEGALAAQTLRDGDAAVFFLESGRAGALLGALGIGGVLRAGVLPESLTKADAETRAAEANALARFDRALKERGADVEARGKELDAVRERRRELARKIQRWSRITGRGAAPAVATAEEIRRTLAPGDVLVLYGWFESSVIAAVVRPGGVEIVTVGSRATTAQAVEAATPTTMDPIPPAAIEAARAAVFGALDLTPKDRRILVSPDGPLDRVPFALLEPTRDVVLVPSGSVLVLLRARQAARGEGVLALGDPAYTDAQGRGGFWEGLGLSRLEASAREAKTVGDVVLLGADASEPGLRDALAKRKRWRSVHLACHGLIDGDRPMLSCLALAPTADDDGLLTSHEILRLSVPADLVVLSGCDTARGKAFRGEGVLGLSRAFLLAGASRVLASQWKVDDEATRLFMETMYADWKQGKPLDDALAHARARLKADPRWSHPRHWAAFVLWGLPE